MSFLHPDVAVTLSLAWNVGRLFRKRVRAPDPSELFGNDKCKKERQDVERARQRNTLALLQLHIIQFMSRKGMACLFIAGVEAARFSCSAEREL